MPSINIESIKKKAAEYMKTPKMQREVQNKVDKYMLGEISISFGRDRGAPPPPSLAAAKFIEVLQNEICSSGLSKDAIDAVSNLSHGSAYRSGVNKYIIPIYFTGELSRPSLDPERYGGINNIVALLNSGVDHKMHAVHGEWHGVETWSKTVIPGAHFIENAIRNFMSNYSTEYGVIDIDVDDVYK